MINLFHKYPSINNYFFIIYKIQGVANFQDFVHFVHEFNRTGSYSSVLYCQWFSNSESNQNDSIWKNFSHKITKIGNFIFRIDKFDKNQCKQWIDIIINDKIIPEVLSSIRKPYVEHSHIRNALDSINSQLFCRDSPIVNFKSEFKINNILIDTLKFTFHQMYLRYVFLKQQESELNKTK